MEKIPHEVRGNQYNRKLSVVVGQTVRDLLYFDHVDGDEGDVESVQLEEKWSGGGWAVVNWADGSSERFRFGRRKPGLSRGDRRNSRSGGRNDLRQRNRRRQGVPA